jgi:hypothetical protein
MTTRNSILLILKQTPGIEFNALLTKISSNYGNINSARAALSRAVKDLSARGLVQKQGKKIFATDKGLSLLGTEMKSKLILRLNELLKHRNSLDSIDSIVPLLSTLIERSKEDRDLLKAARGNTAFYLADVQDLKNGLDERAKHLSYLSTVLVQHLNSLQQLNFTDSHELEWNAESKKVLASILSQSVSTDILVECLNQEFLQIIKSQFSAAKVEGKSIFLSQEECIALLEKAAENTSFASNPINLYAGSLKVQVNYPTIFVTGPFKQLQKITEEKQ